MSFSAHVSWGGSARKDCDCRQLCHPQSPLGGCDTWWSTLSWLTKKVSRSLPMPPSGTILHFHLQKSDVFLHLQPKILTMPLWQGEGGVLLGRARIPTTVRWLGGRVPREGLFQYVKGRSGRRPMWILRGREGRYGRMASARGLPPSVLRVREVLPPIGFVTARGVHHLSVVRVREVFTTYRFCECKGCCHHRLCDCERYSPPIGFASAKIRCKIAFVKSCGELFFIESVILIFHKCYSACNVRFIVF